MTRSRPFNPARLEQELAKARLTNDESARAEILKRYARLGDDGEPIRCTPNRRQAQTSLRKVIYDSREIARAAEREFRALGAERQEVYVCDRTRHGHCHLRRTR